METPARSAGAGAMAASSPAGNGSQQTMGGSGEPITEEEALRRLRLSDDPSAQYYAAWWLGRNRSGHPAAVPLLQEALRLRRPRDSGAGVEENAVARNAARALGKLGAPAAAAIPDLLATLADDDHGLREAAARALGELRAIEAEINRSLLPARTAYFAGHTATAGTLRGPVGGPWGDRRGRAGGAGGDPAVRGP